MSKQTQTERTKVRPVALTTILPFGRSEKEGNYRFSLCIDLRHAYPDNEEPDPSFLQYFFENYGSGDSSIYSAIIRDFQHVIIRTTDGQKIPVAAAPGTTPVTPAPGAPPATPTPNTAPVSKATTVVIQKPFSSGVTTPKKVEGFFSPERVKGYWDRLTSDELAVTKGDYEEGTNSFHGSKPVIPKTVSQFTSPKVDANGLQKASIMQMVAFNGKSVEQIQNVLGSVLQKLEEPIARVDANLTGISAFASSQNKIEVGRLNLKLNKSLEAFDGSGLVNVARIFDTFAFIGSNVLLQRFFGITIDFEITAANLAAAIGNKTEFTIEVRSDEFKEINPGETNGVKWQPLVTPMEIVTGRDRDGNIASTILVKRTVKAPELMAQNYDIGAKLKNLQNVKELFGDVCEKLKTEKKESERIKLKKQLIKLDSSALTRGLNLYDGLNADNLKDCLNLSVLNKPGTETIDLETNPDGVVIINDHLVTRGYRYASIVATPARGRVEQKAIHLGSRKVVVTDEKGPMKDLPQVFQTQVFSINSESGMHSLTEKTTGVRNDTQTTLEHELLIDSVILTWSGENIGMPSVFSNREDEENFEATQNEGSAPLSFQDTTRLFSTFFTERFFPVGVSYERTSSEILQHEQNRPPELKTLTIQYSINKNAKLLLGRNHKICFVPEYKNGWGPAFETASNELGFLDFEPGYQKARTVDFLFKRNEPVKPVTFYLQDPLLKTPPGVEGPKTDRTAVDMRQGESLFHLVIRNETPKRGETKKGQASVRYILPPPIPFEHALWHNKLFNTQNDSEAMDFDESYRWYKKYHRPLIEGELDENKKKITFKDAIDGSPRMKPFYPLPTRALGSPDMRPSCEINYLSDPLSKGFRFQFFKDRHRLIKAQEYKEFEQLEFYFTGKYPKINPWMLILQDIDGGPLVTSGKWPDKVTGLITIRLAKGEELFVTARTILHESYEKQLETFGNYNSFTRYGNNDLLSPPLEFDLVHATDKPLVIPQFNNTLRCEKEIGQTRVSLTNTLNVEQLGIYKDKKGVVRYVEDMLPTGKVELYAKWKEYSDDPRHISTKNWTPLEPVNSVNLRRFENIDGESAAVFETEINISKQLDSMEKTLNRVTEPVSLESMNYAVDVTADYDLRETRFIEKSFWIKNKTKHSGYYPDGWGVKDDSDQNASDQEKKGVFNRVSEVPFVIRFLNNKKPDPPELADRNIILVAVAEDNDKKKSRTVSLNRLRFYFRRGRLSSGNGERIGFVLNEPESKFNDEFIAKGLVSTVGRDIVTDSAKPYDGLYRNEETLLTQANFVITDPYDLKDEKGKPTSDLESFSPMYVPDLGLMTYLPRFDTGLDLWYVDVELDINTAAGLELHNPFLQFALVHYQENSFNYNQGDQKDTLLDCRLSDVYKSGFVYIMGSRLITCTWVGTRADVKIQFHPTSITDTAKTTLAQDIEKIQNRTPSMQKSVKTRFFAFVQWKAKSDIKWVDATRIVGGQEQFAFDELKAINNYSAELAADSSNNEYRLVLIETEERTGLTDGQTRPRSSQEILDDKNSRVVLVSTFKK